MIYTYYASCGWLMIHFFYASDEIPVLTAKISQKKKVIEQWRFPDMGVTPPFSSICLWDIPWSTSYWGNPMAGWS